MSEGFDLTIDESQIMLDFGMLEQTTNEMPFSKIAIGAPFFAIGTFWIKIDEAVAVQLGATTKALTFHNFLSDPQKPKTFVSDVSVPPIRR